MLRRVADAVAEDILDGAAEQLAIANNFAGEAAGDGDAAAANLSFQSAIADDLVYDVGGTRDLGDLPGGAALDEVHFHDIADERGDAVDVALDAVEGGLGVGRRACKLDGELEARERGTEFVGDVAEEAALTRDQRLQLVGHLIEGAAELPDLILARAADANGEIALAELGDGGSDSADRGDDTDGGDPAESAGGADDEEVVGQIGPGGRSFGDADGDNPVLAVGGAVRADVVAVGAGAPFGAWRRRQHVGAVFAGDDVDAAGVEQVVGRTSKDVIEPGEIGLERLRAATVQGGARAFELELVDAVDGGIDGLLLHTRVDGVEDDKGDGQRGDHGQRDTKVERLHGPRLNSRR